MENIIHAAYVLYLVSYLVRDILWLRVITIIAGTCMLPYFYFQPEPLWDAIAWNALFVLINSVQSALLFSERRPAKLAGDEIKLYKMVFRSLRPSEFKKLLLCGSWSDADESEKLTKEGETLDRLMLVFDGSMVVEKDGERVAKLHPGQFIGEMSFLSGGKTSADVIAVEKTRYISWSFDKLRKLLKKQPELRAAIQYIISEDLSDKLQAS